MPLSIDDSQRRAAKIAGFMFLFLIAASNFSQYYAGGNLIVTGDAVKTATNILASERLYRIGIALDLIGAAGNVLLATSLYVVLKRVNQNLALLALLWRIGEATILAAVTLNSVMALRILKGTNYLQAFASEQSQALARLYLSAEGSGYDIGLVFFALGSTVFSYLLYQSRYIPRALSALGIFSSLLVFVGLIVILIFPNADVIDPWFYAPIAIFEVTVGLWLLFKGVSAPEV